MTEHEENKHLDELLDSALSAYSAAEPEPGLETRILSQLREAEIKEAPQLWNFKWVSAGAAVIAAVLLLVLSRVSHHPAAIPDNTVAHTERPASSQTAVKQKLPGTKNGRHYRPQKHAPVHVENAALPLNQRPSVFPSPSPLSEQERLLLSYYARTPREELVAQSNPEEPPVIGDDESNIAIPNLISVPQKSSNTR
jgi:hypothetical protein